MGSLIFTRVGALFRNAKLRLFLLSIFYLFIVGCASSNVSREAAGNVDKGVTHTKDMVDGISETSIADSYGNASQTTKGAIIGGSTGAVAGALTSGVGFLPGAAVGGIFGASYGSYIDSNTNLKDKLENRGVNMIVLGDQILIVIPSARLFDPYTSNLKPQAYSTLDLVTQYVNQYTKMLVKVGGYTNNNSSESVDQALSAQQAQQVAKYLEAAGVDARILYAEGYGGSRLVTKNSEGWDSDNYRIEITLEKLDV